ncbi:hypothetical protein SUGI_0064810 [Cryptomeria japonica]|nr:hypothetical protein SUGI_0064810 [Cryptomeria japonica]
MGTMKMNYLHLLSDRDHLLNLVEVYSNALRRKEEIDELCLQLSMTHSSSHKAEKTIASSSVIHEHDVRTFEIKQIIKGIEEICKKEKTQLDFNTFPDDFSLQFGEEHVGYNFPAPSLWVLPPIALIDSCPMLLIRIISGCTLRAAAMDMERSDWDCHFGVRGLGNDEFLPSLGSNDTFCFILDLVYWLHGTVLIYNSSLIGFGMCFYAPRLGVVYVSRRPLWVEWSVDDSDTMDLVTNSGIFGGLDGSHVDIVGVDLFALERESSSVVVSTEGITNGHFDISLGQTGVFHLDCILSEFRITLIPKIVVWQTQNPAIEIDDNILVNLASAIANKGLSVCRFDFAGNGESEGQFLYGNYWKEAEDLRSVILYFRWKEFKVNTIIGHSKGGNAVLLYASKYKDIETVINISARYALDRGIKGRLGKDYEDRLKQYEFIDVKDRSGNVLYRVTKESLMDRLLTDMKAAALSIDKDCRVLTIHGSKDELIPVTDAFEFDKLIPNHCLHVLDGADHYYIRHLNELPINYLFPDIHDTYISIIRVDVVLRKLSRKM